jgi:hypothetical protein
MPRPNHVPSYRLHKYSGQAIVTLTDTVTGKREDQLLGPHGTPESRAEYGRVIADRLDYATDRAYAQAFAEYGIDVVHLPVEDAAARIRARPDIAAEIAVALAAWPPSLLVSTTVNWPRPSIRIRGGGNSTKHGSRRTQIHCWR